MLPSAVNGYSLICPSLLPLSLEMDAFHALKHRIQLIYAYKEITIFFPVAANWSGEILQERIRVLHLIVFF